MKHYPTWVETPLDDTEGVADWNTLANALVEHGLAFYCDSTGNPSDEPVLGPDGVIFVRAIEQAVDEKPALNTTTINIASDDPASAALAKLPLVSSKRTKCAALLMAGLDTRSIMLRLNVSYSTVSAARGEILREHGERLARGENPPVLCEAITNPGGLTRRGQPRPDMVGDASTSPMARRASDLGVDISEARMLAADVGRITRWGERPRDLKRAAEARERRARKKAQRTNDY